MWTVLKTMTECTNRAVVTVDGELLKFCKNYSGDGTLMHYVLNVLSGGHERYVKIVEAFGK